MRAQVFNGSLFDAIKVDNVIPYWIRVWVATRAAGDAKSWHDVFYKYNSGTYNNQWIVTDYKLFTPGQPLLVRAWLACVVACFDTLQMPAE